MKANKLFGPVILGLRTGQWRHVDSLLFFLVDGMGKVGVGVGVGVSNFVFYRVCMNSYFVWELRERDEEHANRDKS